MSFRRHRSAPSGPAAGPSGLLAPCGRSVPQRRRREGGQATIELALILPVLMLLMLGIIKGGIAYHNYLNLTDAVRVGARQLTLGRGLSDPCTPAIVSTMRAASSLDLHPEQITITFDDSSTCGTRDGARYTGGNLMQGAAATLTATYPCDLTLLGINFAPGCRLKATATETIE